MSSIQGRLLVGTGLAVAVVLVLSGLTLHALVERSLVAEVDRALLASARTAASLAEGDEDEVDLEDLGLAADAERRALIEVWSADDGRPLWRSPSLGERSLPLPAADAGGEPAPSWLVVPGPAGADQPRARSVALRFDARCEPGRGGARPLLLAVAWPTPELDATLATLTGLLGGVGLATLLVMSATLLLVVRRSLRPLEVVADAIAAIGVERLDARLPVQAAPLELQAAVQRVNELLARLEAAFARERAFSSEVAHELRTPIAGLRTTLEVAASRPRTPEEHATTLSEGLLIAGQLQGMVERLLELARLESTRAAPRAEPLRLADAALEAWRPLAAQAAARGLRVEWALDPELELLADPVLVDLVLRNLLENAVVHADEGGRLHVTVARAGDATARLEVGNSGSLLDQAAAEQATRRFWRGDSARSQAALRCGLGLALVERAALALGGRLSLRSSVGGEFVAAVELPGARAEEPVPALAG